MSTYLIGAACFAFAFHVLAGRWRMLAEHYAGTAPGQARAAKALDSVVFETPGSFGGRHAMNPAAVALHPGGLALRGVFPLNAFRKPLFLPFADMQLRPTSWPGLTDPYAVRLARTDAVEIVLSAGQLRWIRDNGGAI